MSQLLIAEARMREISRPGRVASEPLFRSPLFDGAAGPIVVWNRCAK